MKERTQIDPQFSHTVGGTTSHIHTEFFMYHSI